MFRLLSSGLAFTVFFAAACGDDTSEDPGTGGAGSSSSAATGAPTTSSVSSGSGSSSASSASTGAGSTSAGSGGEGGSGAGTGGSGTGGSGTGGAGTGGVGEGGGGTGGDGTGGDGSGGQGTGGDGTGGDGSGGGGVCIDPEFEPTSELANTEVFTIYRGSRPAGGGLESHLNVTVLAAGTGEFTIEDENLDTCTTCVFLSLECDQDDATDCDKKFLADSGTVRIDEVGDDLVGELIDVHLYEVTTDDGTSTPVGGGETRCIESYEIDTPTTPI